MMTKFYILSLTLLVLIILAGCNAKAEKKIIDRSGREVTINGPVNRIISTAPSNTEIIIGLGLEHKLVAIDVHSVNVDGISGGLPLLDFFYPDAEAIINLEPDIIIASGHNATGTGEDPFRVLGSAGIPAVYIPMSKSIDDIYMDIAFIAELLQVREQGEKLIDTMKAEIAEITKNVPLIENKKTVYFEISAAPDMMTFGKDSYINDMINVIGARNIFENENWLVSPGAESIIDRNPDVILTSVNYIKDMVGEIKSRPGFDHINAVINNRIYKIDTNSSMRPSPLIVFALRQMSYYIYPALYEEP
jgi:iron complex transport system substrate-binding protein